MFSRIFIFQKKNLTFHWNFFLKKTNLQINNNKYIQQEIIKTIFPKKKIKIQHFENKNFTGEGISFFQN